MAEPPRSDPGEPGGLGAADVLAALTEPRPHRTALGRDAAAQVLTAEAAAGRLDSDAMAAVLAGGTPQPRPGWPCDLTYREIDVLRLAARGLTNRQIAAELVVSERTVGHHLAHVYDKTARRTRAGAAVFAIEHGVAARRTGRSTDVAATARGQTRPRTIARRRP